MNPLNILLTDASDIYGGGEYFVLQLAGTLRERGHRVSVSCRRDSLLAAKCLRANIPLLPIDFPSRGRLLRTVMVLKKIIHDNGIDIVHTNNNYDRTAGAFAARLAGTKHVTSVHSFHSIQYNLTHWIRNHKATDHFLVDGYCVRDLLIKSDRIPESGISVIHLGVDPEKIQRDESARARVRAEFGIDDDEIVVGNVGRLVPMKGQEFLVKAFARAAKLFPRAKLLLIGDGELQQHLVNVAEQAGAGARITFAGFRDDLTSVYSAFDVYAHSSIEGGGETFPFAVLQALAQRLPVVVTNVGDVAQMVDNGVNGFVVADRDVEALTQSLIKVLQDNAMRGQMAEASYHRFLRDFTLAKMVDRIEGVYLLIHTGEKSK